MAHHSSALLQALVLAVLLSLSQSVQAAETQGAHEDPIDLKSLIGIGSDGSRPAEESDGVLQSADALESGGSKPEGGLEGTSKPSSPSSRDLIASALQSLGTDQVTIDSITSAIPSDDGSFRELISPLRSSATGGHLRGDISTPAQAALAFSDVLDGAFRNATEDLVRSILPTDSIRQRRSEPSGEQPLEPNSFDLESFDWPGVDEAEVNAAPGTDFGFQGFLAGLVLPLDASVLDTPFTAGTDLPAVEAATPQDFSTFTTQLLGDFNRRQQRAVSQVAKFRRDADMKENIKKQLTKACTQYSLAEFLRVFAGMLLGVSPYSAVYGMLSELAGVGYSGLSSQGAAYMNAYCCDMARAAGIGVGNITIGNGSIALGGVGVDLTRLLGLLPEVGSTAADMAVLVTDVVADVANTVVKAVGLPPFKCTIFDWLAFALQNDKRLADRFTKLITAILNLRTRLFTRTLRDADRASADAAKIMDRLNRRGVTRAVSSDPDLGSLVDSLSVLMGDH